LGQKASNKNRTGYVLQDIGMLLVLASLFFGTIVLLNAPSQLKLENLIMLLITFAGVLLAAYRLVISGVVIVGLQIIIYTVYKLFFNYTQGVQIETISFIWLVYPLIAVGSMIIFIKRSMIMETEIEILREQVEELVLIDPLTGLYNLKSLYLDLNAEIALSIRRKTDITLMIVDLRYEAELRKILGKKNYNMLKQKIAMLLQDTLRIEDKIYAIDHKGTLAMILSCDREGAEIVKRRLKYILTAKDAIPDIIDNRTIKLDFQFGYLYYDDEIFKRNVIHYKQKVESELQYDV